MISSRNHLLSLCFISDANQIKRLGRRFKKLDLDDSGSLSVEEFMSLPELQQNPLVQRVIDIFDTDENGEVDFRGVKVFLQKTNSSRPAQPLQPHRYHTDTV